MNERIRKKIVELPELAANLRRLRERGKRIVQCHGCFDIVHPGHVRHLSDAAEHGDVLVVSVTADRQVDKGIGRPAVPHELRCESLAALSMVDYVVVDDDSWAGPLLAQTKPDVYVKGLEYLTNNDPRFLREKQIVESHGGAVVYTSGEVVYSSTRLHQDQLAGDEFVAARVAAYCHRHGVDRRRCLDRIAAFADVRLIVIGDAIIDEYVECELGGIASDAPILQVTPIDAPSHYLGGACVLALTAAKLGADVAYVGFLPESGDASPSIREQLEAGGVRTSAVPVEGRLKKTRYLVEGQKVFKVDDCKPLAIADALDKHWLSRLDDELNAGADGLLAADFGYGGLNGARVKAAAERSRARNVRFFADTSSNRYASLGKFAGLNCDAVFPSEMEVRSYLGEPSAGLPLLVSELLSQNMSQAVAMTLGARGAVAFERKQRSINADGTERFLPEYLPTLARHPVDPLGAGDALTATASLALLAGSSFAEAVFLGSVAAAIAVERLGNEPVAAPLLKRFLESRPIFENP